MKKFLSVFILFSIFLPFSFVSAINYNASPLKNQYITDDSCWRGVVHVVSVASYLAHEGGLNQIKAKYAAETGGVASDGIPQILEKVDITEGLNLNHYWIGAVQPIKEGSKDCTTSLPPNDNSNSGIVAPTTVSSGDSNSSGSSDYVSGDANNTNQVDYKAGPSGLVSDCNRGALKEDGTFVNPCEFKDIVKTINTVINFVLFVLATPIFAIGLCYAGFLYLTASGNSENIGKAKGIFKNLIMGYIVALIAWLVVKTIMVSLGAEKAANLFLDITK